MLRGIARLACRAPPRSPRSAASTARPSTFTSATVAPQESRPLLWAWLSTAWHSWRTALVIVKPETVIAWHRQGLRLWWTWKSRRRTGRPGFPADVRALIRTMSQANPLWGAPRIHGELRKLGIDISQASVGKYMMRRATPPSQTWRTFLANHVQQIAAADFFRRSDGHVPPLVRARNPRARASPDPPRRDHGPSHGRVDGATTP
jgi:hypothetical protein